MESPLDTPAAPIHVGNSQLVESGERSDLALPEGVERSQGPSDNVEALTFEGEGFLELGNSGVRRDQPFSLAFWVRHPKEAGSYVVASQMDPENELRGWVLTLGGREIIFKMTAEQDGEASSIEIRPNNQYQLETEQWRHVTVTYDGSGERAGLHIYFNGERMPFQGSEYFAKLEGTVASGRPVQLGRGYYKDGDEIKHRGMASGSIADFRLYHRELSLEEANVVANWPVLEAARSKAPSELQQEEKRVLGLHYLNVHDKRYRASFREAQRAERAIRENSSARCGDTRNAGTRR